MHSMNDGLFHSIATRRGKARAGLTLLELMMAVTVLLLGLLGYAQVLLLSTAAAMAARENAAATQAARRILESVKAAPFQQAFAMYNGNAGDDPAGAGTAPGAAFDVQRLQPVPGDADGRVGEILFPTPSSGSAQLLENLADDRFGTPRDLNGDGVVDASDQSGSYKLLPVCVRVRWLGAAGDSTVEAKSFIVRVQ